MHRNLDALPRNIRECYEPMRDREEWLRARRDSLGASEAAAIEGINPWRTPLKVYLDKKGETPSDEGENRFTEAGLVLEPAIIEWVEKKVEGSILYPHGHGLFRYPKAPFQFITATPDGFIHMTAEQQEKKFGLMMESEWGVVECKNTSVYMEAEWEKGPPKWVRTQVQQQMLVTGLCYAIVVVLIGGNDLRWYLVPRDEFWIDGYVDRAKAWWDKHIVKDEAPPPMAGDKAHVDQKWPDLKGEIALDAKAADWHEELLEVEEGLKGYKKTRDDLRVRIADAIGPHSAGVLPDGTVYTYTYVERKGYNRKVPPVRARVLRRRKKK